MPLSILVAVANRPELRDELADQLTADGHDVHQAHHSRHAVALLAGRHVDVLILGALEHPGLVDVEIHETHRVHGHASSAIVRAHKSQS